MDSFHHWNVALACIDSYTSNLPILFKSHDVTTRHTRNAELKIYSKE